MAKTTSNVNVTSTWTQFAAATETFAISSKDATIFVAYGASQPAASVVGHPVLANAVYSDYQTTEIAWVKSNSSTTIVAAVTIETA